MSPGIRNALIAMAVLEILFSLGAIAICIMSLILTVDRYASCYDYYYYYDHDDCGYLRSGQYMYSLTSQGLWTGTFIILSACCKIRFAAAPSKSTEQYSTGFSVLAFIMAISLASLDGLGAFSYDYVYDDVTWTLWSLHIANFSIGCTLIIFTLTTMILSSIAIKGCCNCQNQTVPVDASLMPLAYVNRHGYASQPLRGHVSATVGHSLPGMAMQNHQPMPIGSAQYQNTGAVTMTARNSAPQQPSNQFPVASFRQENTMQHSQPRVYSPVWTTSVQQPNTHLADSHLMSIEGGWLNKVPPDRPGMYPVRQDTVPNIGGHQLSHLEGGSLPLQQQKDQLSPASNVPTHAGEAGQSHQAKATQLPIQPGDKNLVTAVVQPQPGLGEKHLVDVGAEVQGVSIQEQQTVHPHQASE